MSVYQRVTFVAPWVVNFDPYPYACYMHVIFPAVHEKEKPSIARSDCKGVLSPYFMDSVMNLADLVF